MKSLKTKPKQRRKFFYLVHKKCTVTAVTQNEEILKKLIAFGFKESTKKDFVKAKVNFTKEQ